MKFNRFLCIVFVLAGPRGKRFLACRLPPEAQVQLAAAVQQETARIVAEANAAIQLGRHLFDGLYDVF